jgi:uncharacterized membrane protein YfcA
MTDAFLGVLIGLVAGILSGLFGVGGGIVMAPGIRIVLGGDPLVAIATPLPAILPTALAGAVTYGRAREVDIRAAGWMIAAGLGGSVGGATLTALVHPQLLLMAIAVLLGWQAIGVLRGRSSGRASSRATGPIPYLAIGLVAGLLSGLLGIGGGLVMVPLLSGWLGVPLKRVLGTSLATIVALVIPGTIVHAALGHIDWLICLTLIIGGVPGASVGARIGLGARERTLRILVGSFLLLVAAGYGARELVALVRG